MNHDPTTAEVVRAFVQPDLLDVAAPHGDRWTLSRRRFLSMVAAGTGLAVAGDLSGWFDPPVAHGAGGGDGVLIIIGMYGGNDSFNTIIDHTDPHYLTQHGPLAIGSDRVLPLTSTIGAHPALGEIRRLWDAGQLAIVEGVGHTIDDFSHFSSMAYWMSGILRGTPTTGWAGRFLDSLHGPTPNLFGSASIGNGVPLHMVGRDQRAISVAPDKVGFGGSTDEHDVALYDAIRSVASPGGRPALAAASARSYADAITVAGRIRPHLEGGTGSGPLAQKLRAAAHLINADLGLRIVEASWGDFDSHAGQEGQHGDRMREFDEAIRALYATLTPQAAATVTVATFSEFGRTSWSNDSGGTDHGSSAAVLVFGPRVKGGLYGQRPGLAGLQRWDRPATTVDARSYVTSVLDGVFGAGAGHASFGRDFENLGLFSTAAGPHTGNPGAGPAPVTAASWFTPVSPTRICDTRAGVGIGRTDGVAFGDTIRIPVTGVAGAPSAGVTAVAVNVTAANASDAGYLTAWPAGSARPDTSIVNPSGPSAVPNLSVVGVGTNGEIAVFNHAGHGDVIVDLVGYFSTAGGSGATVVDPARIIDTRGSGPIRVGRPIEVAVAGQGGIAAEGVTAVAVNVTAVDPSGPGYLTVWPSGEPQPYTSNVNFDAGGATANLTICKVGAGGRISIGTNVDRVHVIVDTFAAFDDRGGGVVATPPTRVTDTRSSGPVPGGGSIEVNVSSAVPASATAVILNVTITAPTTSTFVTAWPAGQPQPATSNINVDAGENRANMVVVGVSNRRLRIANSSGHCHVIVDVMGYVT